jgi:alpha-galactosidase
VDLKIVLIGAASPQWGFTLMRDIIVVLSQEADLVARRPVLVLEDIDEVNLEKAHRLAEMVAARTGNRIRIRSTCDQREAIADADFVITSLAVGSLEAMQADLEIPYEYGIYQPVGDTVSIGGAIRTARNVPAFLSIAREIERHAAPGAWLLNLSNPLSSLTRAVTRETSVKAVGLCHELYGGLATLSGWLGFDYRRWREALEIGVLGINHCGWMQKLTVEGEDAFPKLRSFLEERGIEAGSKRLYDSETPELRHENVKMLLFLRHGVWPYSGDRHNAEFFAEFLSRGTNRGADYGVMLTTIQSRLVDWRGFAREAVNQRLAGKAEIDLDLSEEACSRILRAMTLDRPFYDVANFPYLPGRGEKLPGVPEGAVIETMCSYDGSGPHPVAAPPLPDPLQEHLALHAGIIEDVVEASISGDRRRMIAALERDPLLENMERHRIPEMWDRLAVANREWIHPGLLGPPQ